MKILGIVGSLRAQSYNRSLMNAFIALKPEGVTVELADIGSLPHFNQDDEAQFPAVAQTLKAQVEASDAIIIITPEYNRSVPGVLKNAIDWLSRPYGKNSFNGKRVFVASASVGAVGGALALYDLKKALLHGNAHVLGQPEFFLGNAGDKFDAEGNLIDDSTKAHVENAWEVIVE